MADKLVPGMIIKVNNSEPYKIISIKRNCVCPLCVDELNLKNPPPQPPHIHLEMTRPDGTGRFYLGHFCEETLLSLHKTYCTCTEKSDEPDYDRIFILEKNDRPVQLDLF